MISIQKLGKILANRGNKKIVLLGGCFDILHIGHLRYLKKAKRFGDILVVGINDDQFIKKTKGNHRPHVTENQRAEMLLGIRYVDHVFITRMALYDSKILQAIKPDVLIFANEPGKTRRRKIIAKKIIEEFPIIKIQFISSGIRKVSTSMIENKIKNNLT